MSAPTSLAKALSLGLGCILLLATCDRGPSEPLPVVAPEAAKIVIQGGDNQVAPAGTTLPDLLAVLVTVEGRPQAGVKIHWAVSAASGSVAGLNGSLTDEQGIATARRSLSFSAGRFTTTAVIEENGAAAYFTTVSQVQGANRMVLPPGEVLVRPGDTVLAALPTPMRVLVQDHEDRPVPGVTVRWSPTGGTVASETSVSDAQGIAQMTFTRGPIATLNLVRATVTGLAGSPLTFATPTVPGNPVVVQKISGDDQFAAVFSALPAPFVAHVVDAHGNSVAGAPVAWIVDGDTLAQTLTGGNLPGDPRPVALYTHQLTGEEGVHSISAAVAGRPDIDPVSFTFTALPAPPREVDVSDYDGGYYCWYYGGCGFSPTHVTVQPGQSVAWTWRGSQSHNVVFEDDPTAPVSSALKTSGSHTRVFDTPGTYRYRCTAHSSSFSEGMVGIVTVSGPPTDAATLEKVSGDGQAGTVGSGLALPFVVHVADAEGHSLAGVTVSWITETDAGPTVFAQSITAPHLSDDLRPVAVYHHTVGSEEGVHVITAAVDGRPDIAPVSFTFTAAPAPDAAVSVYDWDDSGGWYSCWYYGNCGFMPSYVTVSVGRTVTWTWLGSQEHNVVFEDTPAQPVSSTIKTTGTHARTFTTPGTYRYRCTLHSTSFSNGMVGTVVVL